ncbi:MAG: zinc-dependent alcohol dehydrogenase [Acidobacteriaceae bacterium]
MKAVVFHGIGDIRLDNVKDPQIKNPNDAIVRLTASAICGTDLHMIRGTLPGMNSGTILGHEGVGVIQELGKGVRNFLPGQRVVIPSTIACGYCSYCRAGYFSQCDNANPNGKDAGTAFFGGPKSSGPIDGLQAEYARVPFANVGLVRLPDEVTDDQAILISDIFPTGYMAAELAEIRPGNTVAVFGCGPVGQFAIASAFMMDAGRVIAVDAIPSRLEMARAQGAEVIDFNRENPPEVIREITGGIGADRVIDAVGIDANRPDSGPGAKAADKMESELKEVREAAAPKTNPRHGNWEPGSAPSMVLHWIIESVAKAGTVSIIGVYSEALRDFPIGELMEKNLTLKAGNCNHRRYIPMLIEKVRTGAIDPTEILTHRGPLVGAIEAYEQFDKREPGWIKVMLDPASAPSKAA